jgi:FKBP-type peptidyl-prolyl cis-trans isomerase FkpA
MFAAPEGPYKAPIRLTQARRWRKSGPMTTELQIENLKPGAGKEAHAGDTVAVHYVGTLTSGQKFDSSRDRGSPFTFKLGAGQVIKGWDQGVAGMKIGEMRKLTIPPELAYGAKGFPPVIPANSTLVFEVELIDVK